MAGLPSMMYSFTEDGIQRLQKDLNYMFQHLDDKNVRRLYTEYCSIKSEEGETKIDGPLLLMTAKGSSTIRLKAGWDDDSSEFVFNLYNSTGGVEVGFNSTGNVVFSGNVNTSEDIYVGNRIFLGWNASTSVPTATLSTRGMYIMEPGTTKYMAAIYSTDVSGIIGTTYPVYEFEIESSNAFNITAKEKLRMYMYAGFDNVSTATINSTDRLELRAFNGLTFINTNHGSHSTAKRGTYIGEDDHSVYVGSYENYYNRVTAVRDQEQKFLDNSFRYFYAHNVRFITSPTSDWTPSVSTNITFNGSDVVITSTRNAWFRVSDTTINTYAQFYSTFPNRDLTQSPDGTAFTTDDWLVFIFFADSTNVNQSHGIFVQMGADSANYYRYYLTSTNGDDWSTGWNLVQRKLGAYESYTGAPSFNNIEWARIGYRGVGDTGVVVVVDYIGLIRANPDDASTYSIYQRDIASTNTIMHNETDSADVMRELDGEPTICQVPINSYYEENMRLRTGVQDFDMEIEYKALWENYGPAAGIYYDTDNWVDMTLSSGRLKVFGKLAGSTIGDYIDCAAFSQYSDARVRFKRQENKYTASFREEGNALNYREVTLYNGPSTRLEYGELYIGHSYWDAGVRIKDISIKGYYEY